MATPLVDETVGALNARIEELQRELVLAEHELTLAKAVRDSYTPEEPSEDGSVIRFWKYNFGYWYAAIKVGEKWFTTQNGEPRYRRPAKTWSELLAWIGERNWHRIEVLA